VLVTLELFFVHGELRTPNSPQQMAKQHQTTLRFEPCLVGKLANVIWGEDWDAKTFHGQFNQDVIWQGDP
jgi:hypothetical protein